MRWEEIIGISATLVILIGFTQNSTTRIRVFNSVGSVLFIVYGILIGAFSTWLLNAACLILNGYKIYKDIKLKNNIDKIEDPEELVEIQAKQGVD